MWLKGLLIARTAGVEPVRGPSSHFLVTAHLHGGGSGGDMTGPAIRWMLTAAFVVLTASAARADVCVAIDSARDMLSADDRAAALAVLTRQFELAGERVVAAGCGN